MYGAGHNRIGGGNFSTTVAGTLDERERKKKETRDHDDSERKKRRTAEVRLDKGEKEGNKIQRRGVPTLPLESSRNLACRSRGRGLLDTVLFYSRPIN